MLHKPLCFLIFVFFVFNSAAASVFYEECLYDGNLTLDVYYDRLGSGDGLIWNLCLISGLVEGKEGEPELLTHEEAAAIAKDWRAKSQKEWRIPTLAELKNLFQRLQYMGDESLARRFSVMAPKGLYWASDQSKNYHRQYWAYDSGDRSVGEYLNSHKFFLLLVRDM